MAGVERGMGNRLRSERLGGADRAGCGNRTLKHHSGCLMGTKSLSIAMCVGTDVKSSRKLLDE